MPPRLTATEQSSCFFHGRKGASANKDFPGHLRPAVWSDFQNKRFRFDALDHIKGETGGRPLKKKAKRERRNAENAIQTHIVQEVRLIGLSVIGIR